MAVIGCIAITAEAIHGFNEIIAAPVSAAIDHRIQKVTAPLILKKLTPVYIELHKNHIDNLRLGANLRATMNFEQVSIGHEYFKQDSATDANSENRIRDVDR